MKEITYVEKDDKGISLETLRQLVEDSLEGQRRTLKKVLLIPPDITRMHSGAGKITAMYYHMLKNRCHVDILPALGTHEPMTKQECSAFFGEEVPYERIIAHNWRKDIIKTGTVPSQVISRLSEGKLSYAINSEVNRLVMDKSHDLIISIGQVVPHEVAGMANYSKNIFVGCGGSDIINKTHFLGAVYGMERIMGRDQTPVRAVFDYAEEKFLKDVRLMYVLTVTSQGRGDTNIHGVFMGRGRNLFEEAVRLSQQKNLTFVEKPFKKAVVYLEEKEFKSTWLGNKAIYRTRMAIADGGELTILAPGVSKFGEDAVNDRLIRKYGYVNSNKILQYAEEDEDLRNNLSVAAHLIHGSPDGRFSVAYATQKLTKEEVEGVSFNHMHYEEAIKKYDPAKLKEGYNTLDGGEEIFFISSPALGLWTTRDKFLQHNIFVQSGRESRRE